MNQDPIKKKGQEIFQNLDSSGKSLFNKDWWYGKIMDWSMKNSEFKTQMFRFVDVLPTLNSGKDVAKHLREYFAEGGDQLPSIFNMGVGIGALAPSLMASTIRKNITQMAKMFITGSDAKEALPKLEKARKETMAFTVDILGEACLSEVEADEYSKRYMNLIEWLGDKSTSWKKNDVIDTDHLGDIPSVNVSVKISSLYSQIHPEAWTASKEAVKAKLRPIFDLAIKKNVFINIDMEKYSIKDLTIEIFEDLLMESTYKDYRHFGIVMQAYLRDSKTDIEQLIEFSKKRGLSFSVRLVKGAYWDYETIGAQQKTWEVPVYTVKAESDANYEDCTELLLKNHNYISLCIASHNVRSISNAIVVAEKLGIPKNALEIQMLYGMAEPIKRAMIKDGYRLREYCPVGELLPGMSYLVRRLLENTSNESFLRSKFSDGAENDSLLKDPNQGLQPSQPLEYLNEEKFFNHPLLDFAQKEPRKKMNDALIEWKKNKLGKTVPIVINGNEQTSDETLESINPSSKQSLGKVFCTNKKQAEEAMQSAHKAFPAWMKTSATRRAAYVEKAANILDSKRYEIMAAQILEAGKTWKEADGDICEAIDFLKYYANQMVHLDKAYRVGHSPGEVSMYQYQGRGVNVVIAPWNFPLAIIAGMVGASLVSGNSVVMKPAEQTSITAHFLMQALLEAGIPKEVVHFLPGRGEVVGDYLVRHKYTAMNCFTGSKEVGLHILKASGEFQPGQTNIKRCLTELGGKNAVIIDTDADLDEAVSGIVYSAFGFQGQKCSACSRVIVLEDVYEKFMARFIEATKSLHMGPSENPSSLMGPVIDQEAYSKINSYIEIGKSEGNLAYAGKPSPGGYFIAPHIFTDIKSQDRLAQEEIFGPIVAVIKATDLENALEIANDTPYALTGGVFSRSPSNIDKVKQEFNVGNLYINRGNTGALVDRHPFGGFKLSGGGSKTGGKDYLLQFMDPKVITENTLRQGFAPEE